ncbi:MAG: phosphotransferase [Clostridia bacterium]|nr:phosphotransferase [Clostridia bacterium]
MDPELKALYNRFFFGSPVAAEIIETGTGEDDFRNTAIVTEEGGGKRVIKLAANGFTFPERILMWQRTIEEYRALGYYCPRIFADKSGEFPVIRYRGHDCVVHAEEFSRYRPLEDRAAPDGAAPADADRYFEDIWTMTARIAAKRLDHTDFPSGYCLFETFSPDEATDEVLDNALEWKRTADALPAEFSAQAQRIWRLWNENRAALQALYPALPTSVFQADLNPTNLLIGEDGSFKGVYDFNLSGRDVFLNYLMRENYDDFEPELERIRKALLIARKYYAFNAEEKAAALPLYRCLKPLWYNRVYDLKQAGDDRKAIRNCLDQTEYYLTADIDLSSCME